MLSYEDALKKVLENVRVMEETEEKRLLDCLGQVTVQDIHSDLSLPALSTSIPDGYAVRSADIKEAGRDNPVTLRIAGTVRAGIAPRGPVPPGAAVRIMTGSILPDGADCVVRFEDTDEPQDKNGPNPHNPSAVKIYAQVAPGANVREPGSNTSKGVLILPRGTVIGPAQVSALAFLGRDRIRVVRRPVMAVIATGDELINPGKRLSKGKCYNCNMAAIASLVTHYGGIPRIIGIARDNEASLLRKIGRGMTADAIITSGGVSKGDYDLVRLLLAKLGKIVFSRINMGPGAAVAFGLADRSSTSSSIRRETPVPVFALAGPPAGCMINFETLVRPALLKMRGLSAIAHSSVEATAVDSVLQKMSMPFVRWTNLRKVDGEYRVMLNMVEKMGPLASMVAANSLTIIPEGHAIKAGDRIQVLPLDWRRDNMF
ncbi:MAG: Molybdopterin molybdenumtransferase [Syntrophorhabdaceae bacterium PtaU1.Bin034]|nr:MAG: Molybdopterin molybdenumtransferase [Syntrophorhabdaceae bacterium PtaU1.Bin034]